MKRSDKYPSGTEEDARNLPRQVTVLGLHPLVWAGLIVFTLAGIGIYAETVGFYELDDLEEIMTGEESDHEDDHSDHEDDNGDDEKPSENDGKD